MEQVYSVRHHMHRRIRLRYNAVGGYMMQGCRWMSFAYLMASGLALAGCSDPADNIPSAAKPADPPPVSEQVDIRIQDDVVSDEQEKREPAPAAGKATTRKHLDLSMPPQPVIAPESIDSTNTTGDHLLPDLFQKEQKPGDSRSTQFNGRVLMQEGEEESLDSFEGGQLIFEKKTR